MTNLTLWQTLKPHLEPYKLRKRGSIDNDEGQWRCNSPGRQGAKSKSLCIYVAQGGNSGCYNDHNGGGKGSLYELAERFGIKWERAKVESSKRGYKNLADYAQAHGVEESIFAAAGWRFVPEYRYKPEHNPRPALSFPTAAGTRYRYLDGNKPAYIHDEGYKTCWYGLKRALEIANGRPLVLVNGPPSVVVGQHFGIPAFSLSSGEHAIPDDLLKELNARHTGDVWVAHDCDEAGLQMWTAVEAQLTPRVKRVDMWLGDKGDLADFCKLWTSDAYDELSKRVIEPELERPYITLHDALDQLVDELNGETIPESKPILNPYNFLHQFGGLGHILAPGKAMFMVSVSGGTKTMGQLTGIRNRMKRCPHEADILYTPEWVDGSASEVAQWMLQQQGGEDYETIMLHKLALVENANGGIEHGRMMSSPKIRDAIAHARQLQRLPGDVYILKEPGLSVEKLTLAIEKTCTDIHRAGKTPRVLWVDFAQLLWIEKREGEQTWIEEAVTRLKTVCRKFDLFPIISSQMRKDAAESAKTGGKLTADAMQWLSDQQANLILAFVPHYDDTGRAVLNTQGYPTLRGRILKNSKAGGAVEFFIPFDPARGLWLDAAKSTAKIPTEAPEAQKEIVF